MDFRFQNKSKFSLLAINNIYTDLPSTTSRLSDGTWVMQRVPVPDIGVWKEWIGSIRLGALEKANLILLVEEPSDNPEIVDAVHKRLGDKLRNLYSLLHLKNGIESPDGADLLLGSSSKGMPEIRQMSEMPTFYQSKGFRREPITFDWLEEGVACSNGLAGMKDNFSRITRGLNTLFRGLKEITGQDRIHQFVRSLEAVIQPTQGNTRNDFTHRCQTFAKANEDTKKLLREAFDMRSDTEHLQDWQRAVRNHPEDKRENICWQRTRQIEALAINVYSRLLQNAELRKHFQTDEAITAFWKLPDDQKRKEWGNPLNIMLEPLIENYDQWGRAIVEAD